MLFLAGRTYYYWLRIRSFDGSFTHSHGLVVVIEDIEIPTYHELTTISSAFPNPMRVGAGTNFTVEIKENDVARLQIYNVRGQLVKEFSEIQQGSKSIFWDGRDQNNRAVASGVYFYRLSSPSANVVLRLVLIN